MSGKDRSFMRLVMARLRTEHRNGTSVEDASSLVRGVLQRQAQVNKPEVHDIETTEHAMLANYKKL